MQYERRKKICFVITKGVWGGAQKYLYNLAISLPKESYDVFVICGDGKVLKNKLEEKGVRVFELTDLKRDISFIREYKSFLAMLKIIRSEKPDVLHLNSPKASGLGVIAGRLCFTPKIIQTVHGWTFNEDRGLLNNMLVSFFSWITIMLCHKTIVIAREEEKQALVMPFVGRKKIILIRNGIEKTPTQGRGADQSVGFDFKEKPLAQKELLSQILPMSDIGRIWTSDVQVESETLWFGTIAELHKNKGLEYAIEAVSKLTTPFLFFIIGEGKERKKLEDLIEKYNLKDKVFLTGFVDNANQYLKAFDIFMLTSIKEGLPYTLLEAGYIGLPCVSTNVGGIPDIIENGVSGILVTKARTGEITRALEYLIQNPDKQKSYGEKLKEKVEKDFSLDQMLEKTLELYWDNF